MDTICAMNAPATVLVGVSASLLWLTGCDGPPAEGDGCELAAGELVITELMPDPADPSDNDSEWFEIYNATDKPLVLNRLVLAAAGSGDFKELALRDAGTIPARSYFVLGNNATPVDYVDYSYDNLQDRAAFELGNTLGTLKFSCKGVEIDAISYGVEGGLPVPEAGKSLSLDGGMAPDAILNDGAEWWCGGGETYDGVNYGTPGAANIICGSASCEESSGEERNLVAPEPGELVVTELLADVAGPDQGKEWLELYVAAGRTVDLNAMVLRVTKMENGAVTEAAIGGIACAPAASGSYVVIGGSADTTVSGGVAVDVVASAFDKSGGFFVNGVTLRVELMHGDDVIDQAVIPAARELFGDRVPKPEDGTFGAGEGVSVSLDRGMLDADRNDTVESFCASRGAAAEGNFELGFGTPGVENAYCGIRTCLAGGTSRDVVAPGEGDLVITEALPDAEGSDAAKEWVELYVAASTAIDLNGIQLTDTNASDNSRSALVAVADCLVAQPGDYLVIGGSNPGVTTDALALGMDGTSALLYSSETTLEVSWGGTLIDSAELPEAKTGISLSLDPNDLTAVGNDTASNFCLSTTVGLFVDGLGTPGFGNVCGASCLDGGVPVAAQAPLEGELVITEVYPNPPGRDGCREWVEFYNWTHSPVHINGVSLWNAKENHGATDTLRKFAINPPECLEVPSLTYAVLAGQGAAMDSVSSLFAFECGSGLRNVDSDIWLEVNGVVIDIATYEGKEGASDALVPNKGYEENAEENDSKGEPKWCFSTKALNGFTGDGKGSPGVANICL